METKSKAKFKPDPKLKLMDQFCQVLRYQYYAYRTEQSDSNKTLRYIKFHGSKPILPRWERLRSTPF